MTPRTKSRPVFSRFYARVAGPALDRAGAAGMRRRLLAGLSGEVLEIGAGNGLNFPHYPAAVTRVVAVEPEPRLRALARQAAAAAPVPVDVVDGVAERLPAADGSADAVVVCLTLCSVADQAAALREIRRVLRPEGRLRFFEHVQAPTARMRRVQRVADATVWPLLAGGCHTGRDTLGAMRAAGLRVADVERLVFPETRMPFPASFHVLGTALPTADPEAGP
ncbi:class I SAM-dependent methyltransferase [Streptomyces sp. NPDC051940]|uniref:class I SAM-dependent methyltransferase n=1 Tax=Streptomyces sp. NPDC051940 TaxID=3155675 RepID=UPI00341ED3EB